MRINEELVSYLEDLSQLRLTADEKVQTKEQLSRILDYFAQLSALETGDVEALSHTSPLTNCFRADEVAPSSPRDQILAGAPDRKDGCFKVPKTVE